MHFLVTPSEARGVHTRGQVQHRIGIVLEASQADAADKDVSVAAAGGYTYTLHPRSSSC